jgi:N-acetylmuramoyl-L-alanine amidase
VALQRVGIPSPNVSSRGGSTVRLIVVHTSEGAQTYQSLGNFFANPSSQVSSHTGIDDARPGVIGEYCGRSNKSWTAADANPYAVQTELCTPSGAAQGWSAETWAAKTTMLSNCAAWIAEEAAIFGIPIVKLTPAQAQGGAAGVCGHGDLGAMGGGHTDPGPNFPWSQVLAMAAGGPQPQPKPEPEPEEDDDVFAPCTFTLNNVQQAFYVDAKGTLVHSYARAGQAWITETLGGGWDPKTGLSHDNAPVSGTDQVWGMLASGKGGQCYWAGTKWVTQPLP